MLRVDSGAGAAESGDVPLASVAATPALNAEAEVVTQAMRLIVACVRGESGLLAQLYAFADVGDAFVDALLRDEVHAVRVAVRRGIEQLCAVSADARPFFVRLLLSSVDEVYDYSGQSTAYFALLANLLLKASAQPAAAAAQAGSAAAGAEATEAFSLEATARDFAARIQRRRIVERSAGELSVMYRYIFANLAHSLTRPP